MPKYQKPILARIAEFCGHEVEHLLCFPLNIEKVGLPPYTSCLNAIRTAELKLGNLSCDYIKYLRQVIYKDWPKNCEYEMASIQHRVEAFKMILDDIDSGKLIYKL